LLLFISQHVQYVDTIEQSGSKIIREKEKERHGLYNFIILVGVKDGDKL